MSDVRQFLDEMMPRIHRAEIALHNGDAGPRVEMWSHADPIEDAAQSLARLRRDE